MTFLADLYKNIATSGGTWCFNTSVVSAATTAATATTGRFSFQIQGQAIGSTWPGTTQQFQIPTNIVPVLTLMSTNSVGRGGATAVIYKVGTVSFTSTGNAFTHDAATFPLLQAELGQANQPQAYLPFLKITTAITGTSPVIRLQTATGGPGIVTESGGALAGTTSITVPLASIGSCFFLPLDTATAARDITQIRVDTASTAGAAEVWMYSEVSLAQTSVAGASVQDIIGGSGLDVNFVGVATATSGVVTSQYVAINYSNAAVTQTLIQFGG
jgi:hypothetical protein